MIAYCSAISSSSSRSLSETWKLPLSRRRRRLPSSLSQVVVASASPSSTVPLFLFVWFLCCVFASPLPLALLVVAPAVRDLPLSTNALRREREVTNETPQASRAGATTNQLGERERGRRLLRPSRQTARQLQHSDCPHGLPLRSAQHVSRWGWRPRSNDACRNTSAASGRGAIVAEEAAPHKRQGSKRTFLRHCAAARGRFSRGGFVHLVCPRLGVTGVWPNCYQQPCLRAFGAPEQAMGKSSSVYVRTKSGSFRTCPACEWASWAAAGQSRGSSSTRRRPDWQGGVATGHRDEPLSVWWGRGDREESSGPGCALARCVHLWGLAG